MIILYMTKISAISVDLMAWCESHVSFDTFSWYAISFDRIWSCLKFFFFISTILFLLLVCETPLCMKLAAASNKDIKARGTIFGRLFSKGMLCFRMHTQSGSGVMWKASYQNITARLFITSSQELNFKRIHVLYDVGQVECWIIARKTHG